LKIAEREGITEREGERERERCKTAFYSTVIFRMRAAFLVWYYLFRKRRRKRKI
jgi:hypothetical protein